MPPDLLKLVEAIGDLDRAYQAALDVIDTTPPDRQLARMNTLVTTVEGFYAHATDLQTRLRAIRRG